MSRIGARVVKLERDGTHGWRRWDGRPAREWPDHALAALIAENEGWPPGRIPTDAELRAIVDHRKGCAA